MVNKRKNPKFVRWSSASVKRVHPPWRKPHGINSKVRAKFAGKLPMPNIGYGADKETRFLHPSGFREVMIDNADNLKNIDVQKEAARISSSVGKRKRTDILKKAEEMKIKVLNP